MGQEVYAIVTGDVTSGGPELMHQLVDTLNQAGGKAAIVYFPFEQEFAVPEPYRRYQVPVVRWSDVPKNARVVVPETYSDLLPRLEGYAVYFWWLSVDIYFRSLVTSGVRRRLPARLLPLARRVAKLPLLARWIGRATVANVARDDLSGFGGVHLHLYQSEYARLFLEGRGLGPSAYLGDYINDAYLAAMGGRPIPERENIVAYNPAKGLEHTQAVLKVLAADGGATVTATPIVGMTRDGVRDLLARAKLYIDFGSHPGKDRIPREAAAMGACVLVNRRGSADNALDVPLPDAYKVDDRRPGFETEAAAKIRAVVDDFASHSRVFDEYRQRIAGEKDAFAEQARRLFPAR